MLNTIKGQLLKIKSRFEAYGGPDTRETFAGELNYESGKFFYLVFICIFILLPYIPNDITLHQYPIFIISMKISLSLLCIVLIALRLTERFKHKPGLLLMVAIGYLYFCSTLIMASAGEYADTYISSFSLILVLPIFLPLTLKFKVISTISAVMLFFVVGVYFHVNLASLTVQNAVIDLLAIMLICLLVSYGLNNLRYNAWKQRNQLLVTLDKVEHRDHLLRTVNDVATILLQAETERFSECLHKCMGMVAEVVKADRVYIWKNRMVDGALCCTQIYEWSEGAQPQQSNEYTMDVPYSDNIAGLEEILSNDNCLNGIVSRLSSGMQAQLIPQGIVSIIVVPIFIDSSFWGFAGFDDCYNERIFTKGEEAILRSVGLLFSHAYHRNEIIQNIRDTSRELEIALKEATAASKAKSEFLSNMSHEMRTPMNAIIGMTAIGENADKADEKNYAFNKIGDASSHLLGVINDVLDMAKIEANKLELMPIEYNFDRMLQNVITVVNFRLEEKRQRLTVNVDDKVPYFVRGDNHRLAQVITNLMSNAIKFTPNEGAISLNVSLLEEHDDWCMLRIEVADNGIGLSGKQQKRLFLAFEQADNAASREYGGTGLGLVISKRVIELMDGKIWVESELGKGARFIFTIKVERSRKELHSLLSQDVNWRNVRILAVDDLPETRSHLQSIFSSIDVKCDTADDGFHACRKIEKNGPYDIYFVDWKMPEMDGVELTREIKSKSETKQSVVIMITAADWGQIKEEAISAGVDMYLPKPLFSSAVIDCMNQVLGAKSNVTSNYLIDGEFSGKRMLIVEDIEINCEILVALLKNTGITIDCAENGREAVDMVAEEYNKYDIVLMDIQMPYMDGLEATQHIRALPNMSDARLPIIAMTANVFKDDIERYLAAGMDNHLGKPIDIEKMIEILRIYLTGTS